MDEGVLRLVARMPYVDAMLAPDADAVIHNDATLAPDADAVIHDDAMFAADHNASIIPPSFV